MRVIIQPDTQGVARWAARYIAARINGKNGGRFVIGLPTGSTPVETYKELIKLHKAGKVSFANVVTFNMDEYAGLPADHPQSYRTFMWRNFFDHIDINPQNVNLLDGNAPDAETECTSYEEKIAAAGGIDLFLGGIGSDGHVAFNEPFSSMTSRTRVKSLTAETIAANSRFFGGDVAKVPKLALTVGVGTVMDAREVVILATGHGKARALHHVIEGAYSHVWTASALQTHPRGMIVCDDAATYELRVGTARYFLDIEKDNLDPATIAL
ncbi:MAG: glucosamine-6-phosphate deaminase [Rikenellaceae bacterium]|nr:glucosamine-6-phosphate deaminase [Rikenellaceae bacterium]MCL2692338.1 glucosamine-6-phosphate deaminase [Rikenellaceae bacterium]